MLQTIKQMQHRQVWRLAGPMILSNLSVALLGLVDTAVIGHLEHAWYLGAVALGAVIFDFIYWGMGFLRMGTTGLAAQAHGQDDADKMRNILGQALLVAGLIASVLLIIQGPLISIGLYLLDGSIETTTYARQYFDIRIWSAPAVLSSMAMMGWLLGMQNVRVALIIGVTMNLINIVLDLVFVVLLEMDVRGVAWASLIAEYSGLLIAIYYIRIELRSHRGRWQWQQVLDLVAIKRMLVLNHDLFIRTLCLIFVFAFFARQGAQQSDVILAANALLLNFHLLMALGLDGFANALEALIGRAIGKKSVDDFKRAVEVGALWSLFTALVFTLLYVLAGEFIIRQLTDIESVRSTAIIYLPWMRLSPLISVWSFLLDGIFIGATRGREMRNSMLIASFLVFLPGWYLLQGYGNHGLWLAFMLFMIVRAATLGFDYFKLNKRDGFFVG